MATAAVVGVDVHDRDQGVVVGIAIMVAVDDDRHLIHPEDVRRDHVRDLKNFERSKMMNLLLNSNSVLERWNRT